MHALGQYCAKLALVQISTYRVAVRVRINQHDRKRPSLLDGISLSTDCDCIWIQFFAHSGPGSALEGK